MATSDHHFTRVTDKSFASGPLPVAGEDVRAITMASLVIERIDGLILQLSRKIRHILR